MIEVSAGVREHTVARDVAGIARERYIGSRRHALCGKSPDTIAEAVRHARPDRGLIAPFHFGDRAVGRGGDVAQIVLAYRADEKVARVRSVCPGGAHGKLFAIRRSE